MTEKAIVETAGAEVSKLPAPTQNLVVLARNPKEMMEAQAELKVWFQQKLEQIDAEILEANANIEQARKGHIRTGPFRRLSQELNRKRVAYEKALAAVEAGYFLIPDFPIEILCVRTSRKRPPTAIKSHKGYHSPHIPHVETNSPPLGEGKNVSQVPFAKEWTIGAGDSTTTLAKATEFDETLDFPFRVVKPQVMSELTRAAQLKIFDQIGFIRQARRDPMVIGQVVFKTPGRWAPDKIFNFLITWWIDTRDLLL